MAREALLVVAPSNFRDEELFHTKEELESAGIKTTVASKTTSIATGMFGGTAKPDTTLEDVDVTKYDALVFVGGSGANVYFDDPTAHRLAREAYENGKVVAAICIAPSTLANAGLLRGKRATCFPSEAGNLRGKDAVYTGKPVEQDGRIITADGPGSAREFGRVIARVVNQL